jgi:hypothetical protein
MTLAAYEQLLILLKQCVEDNPRDKQVLRLAKGLVKALNNWLQYLRPVDTDQARSGRPRTQGLASVNASLVSTEEISDGKSSRETRRDPDR